MNIVDSSGKILCDHRYAAEKFKISRASLYRLAGRGLVKGIKSGRRTLWSVESIVGYLNSQPEATIRTGQRPASERTLISQEA